LQIKATITLFPGDIQTMTMEEAANAVLTALGGDPAKDHCTVEATIAPTSVGTPTLPPIQPIEGV
jgi:hypothetical protein